MRTLSENAAAQADIDKVVEITRQKFDKNLRENKYWRRKLTECVSEDYPLTILTKDHIEERLSRLTPSRMQQIGSRIYQQSEIVTFRQNPE